MTNCQSVSAAVFPGCAFAMFTVFTERSSMQKENQTRQLTLTGLMTAILCILAPISLVLPFSPVPFSLGTLAVYFAVTVLGGRRGFLCTLLYLLLGFAGLPVFSGFTGGLGKLLGPTGGYLIGYLLLALIYGFFLGKWFPRLSPCFAGMLLGTACCYAFGTCWLAYQSDLSPSAAFMAAVLPFLPADFVKMAIALLLGREVRCRLKRAGLL